MLLTQHPTLITHHSPSDSALSTPHSLLNALLQHILAKGLDCRFPAKGHSMSPFIQDGDVITVSPLQKTSAGLGDVVAFIHPGSKKLTIHRVVGKRANSYCIKGDSSPDADGLIPKSNIIGLVTKVERKGKEALLGLGPERWLIAFLTRRGLLFPLLTPIWKVVRPLVKLE